VGQAVLWFMRLSILAMIAVGLAVLYGRTRMSPAQKELVRYVEIEVPALKKVQGPIVDRLGDVLGDRHLPPERARRILVDEVMPGLVRLRKLSEAPIAAAQTQEVGALAREYQGVVEQYMEVCRTAVRAIDEPGSRQDPREALLRVHRTLAAALSGEQAWAGHVQATSRALQLSK
jgi:hypothetical protein